MSTIGPVIIDVKTAFDSEESLAILADLIRRIVREDANLSDLIRAIAEQEARKIVREATRRATL